MTYYVNWIVFGRTLKEIHILDWIEFGKALKEARIRRYGKRSISKVCRLINQDRMQGKAYYRWDPSNLSKIERGKAHLGIDKLCELCMYYGIYPTDIIMKSTPR